MLPVDDIVRLFPWLLVQLLFRLIEYLLHLSDSERLKNVLRRCLTVLRRDSARPFLLLLPPSQAICMTWNMPI